jgi:hypothetical protein
MPKPREQALRAFVDEHSIHGTLHALIEVCYRKAAENESSRRLSDSWRRVARELTSIEAMAAHLDF